MKHYLESVEDVCTNVETTQDGISSQEATARLEKNGKNKLAEGKKSRLFCDF